MNSRIKPDCAVAQDLKMLKDDLQKKQKRQENLRKPRPEWSKRGVR